jgi:hypothetical protein
MGAPMGNRNAAGKIKLADAGETQNIILIPMVRNTL